MEILAIIPARGGSKGVPRKNIKDLNGLPLIAYSIIEGKKSKHINRVVVSTDDQEIAEVSKKYGGEVPVLRPKELSGDNSNTIDGVIHMLAFLKETENYSPDLVMLLQCTSPLRKQEHIDGAIEKLINSSFDGVISICEAEVNPYWANVLQNNRLKYFIEDGKYISKRQDLPKVYRYNGGIYLVKREALFREDTFEVENLTGYIMDEYSSVDIDTELDFRVAEAIINFLGEKL